MKLLLLSLMLLGLSCTAWSRDWHSADGSRTIEGSFVRLAQDQLQLRTKEGRPLSIALNLLSPNDQAYARRAQAAVDEAIKLGPKSFEVAQLMKNGSLCRMAVKLASGTVLYTGEQFYLCGEPAALNSGARLKDQTLYFAGMRNLHMSQGSSVTPVKAYSRSLEAAMTNLEQLGTGQLAADIYEPILETVEATGIGVALSDDGLLLVDAALVVGAASIDVDVGKNHAPGLVVASDPKLGVAVVSCKGSFQAARLAPKKVPFESQPVYIYGFGLEKRGLGSVSIGKGKITKLASPKDGEGTFDHDAQIGPDVVGGLVVGEKGEPIGLLKARPAIKKQTGAKKSTAAPEMSDVSLATCVRMDSLSAFLKTVPKIPALKPATSSDLKALADDLKHSVTVVKVLRQSLIEPTPKPAAPPPKTKAKSKAASPTKPTDTAAASWSLSKSGVRHNSKCRYFNAELPCKETDGTPCKLCGG